MNLINNFFKFKRYKIRRNRKSIIEPEEILPDVKIKDLDDSENNYSKIELPITKRINFLLFLGILIIFSILFIRIFYLQIIKMSEFEAMARNNGLRIYYTLAPRGIIYDRFGVKLVDNIPSFDLFIIPADLPKAQKERDSLISLVAEITGINFFEIKQKLEANKYNIFTPILIKENLNTDLALYIETQLIKMPGVYLEKNAKRVYGYSPFLSHVIGYIGRVSKEDLKNNQNLINTDFIGKMGIEFSFDKYLRGINGKLKFELNSKGEIVSRQLISEPVVGNNIELTIDAELQKKAYEVLNSSLKNIPNNFGGAVVALNPKTGEILAAVSIPSFDNNKFSFGLSSEEYKRLIENPLKPFFNRVISGEYPPGSTIKPFIALAALEENVIEPNQKIYAEEAIYIKNQYNPNIVYKFSDWKKHGWIDMFDAIAESSNVYFYTVGGGFGDIKGLGIENIKKYLSLFNFGNKLNIDIVGERSGFLPDKKWKRETKNEDWFLGDTYNISIGQGGLLVTPLQLAVASAVIANGGRVVQPFIVKKIFDNNKNTIKEFNTIILRENFLKDINIQVVKKAMRKTVTSGTAKLLNSLPMKAAGKTGTAQFGQEGRTHAWFTAFAPYDNPDIVLVVLSEGGGEGFSSAVPVANEILWWYYENRIKKSL